MARPVRASLMITCLGDMFFPKVGVKIVRLLRRPSRAAAPRST